ncbi:hypothetical protein [Chryseobacterium balustinum]|uniref:hypothetical protein n=1 Tax=Chryseobacterium balustinum TaxID=246 RepID=UPI003CFAB9C8
MKVKTHTVLAALSYLNNKDFLVDDSGVIKTNLGAAKNLKNSLCLKIYLTLG